MTAAYRPAGSGTPIERSGGFLESRAAALTPPTSAHRPAERYDRPARLSRAFIIIESKVRPLKTRAATRIGRSNPPVCFLLLPVGRPVGLRFALTDRPLDCKLLIRPAVSKPFEF